MKTLLLSIFAVLGLLAAKADPFDAVDLEKLEKAHRADVDEPRKKLDDEDRDLDWMMRVYEDVRMGTREVTQAEASRIVDIYHSKSGRDKIYAFSMLPLFQDVASWSKDLEIFAKSENKDQAEAAVLCMQLELASGTESEKEYLANKPGLLDSVDAIPERFPENEGLASKVHNIDALATPLKGKLAPASKEVVSPGAVGWHPQAPVVVKAPEQRFPLPVIVAIFLTLFGVVVRIRQRRGRT